VPCVSSTDVQCNIEPEFDIDKDAAPGIDQDTDVACDSWSISRQGRCSILETC
jgi:hypothetical protein